MTRAYMRFGATVALLLAAGLPSGAADGDPPLDWPACVALAAEANPDLVGARAAVGSSEAVYFGSRSERHPQLTAGGDFTRSDTRRDDGVNDGPTDDYQAGLTARQLLYAGGRVAATIEQQKAELDAALAGLRRTASEVSFDLKTAFANLLYAQEFEGLAGRILDRRTENLRLLELRFEGGREHKGSYLRIKAAASEAQYDLARAARAVTVARRNLARVLGRSDTAGLAVAGAYDAAAPGTAPDFEALTLHSPLRDGADARRRVADAAVRRARSAYRPELSLAGSVSRGGEDFFPQDERWAVGVAIDLPLFDGGSRRYGLAAAQADRLQAEANLLGTTYDVRAELERAYVALVDDVDNIGIRAEFLEAAQVRAEIARSQYTSGLLSFEDWDRIENDLIDTERAMLAARRDAMLSEATWELAAGKDVFGED